MGEVIYITGRNRLTVSMQKKTGIYSIKHFDYTLKCSHAE